MRLQTLMPMMYTIHCYSPDHLIITLSHYHLITLSPSHLITSSPHHLITLSPHHLITSSPYHLITLSPIDTNPFPHFQLPSDYFSKPPCIVSDLFKVTMACPVPENQQNNLELMKLSKSSTEWKTVEERFNKTMSGKGKIVELVRVANKNLW
jgi:hypothetical protein